MSKNQKIFNLLLGASFLAWSFLGFKMLLNSEITVVRLITSILNAFIGFLIFFREPVKNGGSLESVLLSLPSFIFSGVIFKLSMPFSGFKLWHNLVFITGFIISIVAFVKLGKSFGLFPKIRSIKTNGLYGVVRHPAYLGESLMILACSLKALNLLAVLLLVCFTVSLIVRIKVEEKVLLLDPAYMSYSSKVKYRLIPQVW